MRLRAPAHWHWGRIVGAFVAGAYLWLVGYMLAAYLAGGLR